jgi:hypothetical protein
MAMFNNLVKMAVKPLPRMVTPNSHAVVDMMIAGAFLATAGLFWRRNRRAAAASLLCGGAQLGVSLLTDYAGGDRKPIKFSTRRKLDLGLAAMTAAMPEFLNFKHQPERRFFITQGMVITVTNELTRFPEARESERKGWRQAA